MLLTEQDKISQELERLAERHGNCRTALIPILQTIQKKYKCVNDFAMQKTADLLGIHPVEVHGVVSFYSFLTEQPQGRFVVRLCRTITCDLAGKDSVARQLENDLDIEFGQTTENGMFTLEWANCLGMCDQGPAMLVNDRVYTKVTPEKVHEIIEECRSCLSPHAVQGKEDHVR